MVKYWIATNDSRTRDSHAEMLGSKPIPMYEKFTVGDSEMMYPGDPTAPAEEVCNCRCALAFEIVAERQSPETPVRRESVSETPTDRGPDSDNNNTVQQVNATRDALLNLIDRISAGEVGNGIDE